jgi:predicted TIM-barrel fold metal-dependent hydrolase
MLARKDRRHRLSNLYEGPVIDAHHHLWDISLGRHPWITSQDNAIKSLGDVAFLKRDYLIADYLADIGPQNVVGSVYVEAAWDRSRDPLEEVTWVTSLERPRALASRLIAWAHLREPGVEAVLERLCRCPEVVGIRETIRWHPDPAKRWTDQGLIDDPAWRRGFAAFAGRGLVMEWLMNPYQAEEVTRLAAEFPEQTFIVNHCGTPMDRDADGLQRWRDGLRRMGTRENIAIKVSNFGAYAPDRSIEGLRGTVMACIDAFGPKRSMFGTDYPVAKRSMIYQALCDSFKQIVSSFSPDEQRDLFHDNAARYYRFA